MSAILFGSISTVADTSELQRESFNQAFEQHDLDWNWNRDEYLKMLKKSGGQQRIADYASSRGVEVDAAAVHQTKSDLFQKSLTESGVSARPGVVETVRSAKNEGMKVGLVTTTSPENVAALLDGLQDLQASDFDVVTDTSKVEKNKPDGAAYAFALRELGEEAADCIALEDNVDGVQAAQAAGLRCVAFPNENTAEHDFSAAQHRVDSLSFDEVRRFMADS